MERVQLQVRLREDMSKSHLKQMRRQGQIPATLYGKGDPTLSLELGIGGLVTAIKTEAGTHTVIDLKIDGGKKSEGGHAVIKMMQKHPITRKVLHVDFERVSLSDMIVTMAPITLLGVAPGVKEGGMVDLAMDAVEVRTRADHQLSHLDVDISELELGQFIHASDLILPEGVELAGRPEDLIVACRVPHVHAAAVEVEVEEAPAAEAAPAEAAAPSEEETS